MGSFLAVRHVDGAQRYFGDGCVQVGCLVGWCALHEDWNALGSVQKELSVVGAVVSEAVVEIGADDAQAAADEQGEQDGVHQPDCPRA